MQIRLDRFYQLNRRILIWAALAFLIYLMRDFFALIFVTFLLVSFTLPVIDWFDSRTRLPRTGIIVVLYLAILAGLVGATIYVTPRVFGEASTAVRELTTAPARTSGDVGALVTSSTRHRPSVLNPIQRNPSSLIPGDIPTTDSMADALDITTYAELLTSHPLDLFTSGGEVADEKQIERLFTTNIKSIIVNMRDDVETSYPSLGPILRVMAADREIDRVLSRAADNAAPWFVAASKKVGAVVTTTLLSLLFSFLIVLDMTRLKGEVLRLGQSRLHDFYEESAGPVVRFASVIARAFRAQAMIALTNTVLTAIGFLLLGVPKVMLLSIIVFFFSFIPVLGVFISTAPALVIALNYAGYGTALGVVVLVIIIHALEAYVLNPLIYGHHLKLNPVLVLVILFLGHHSFGLWGMVLGVPVAYYFIYYVFAVPRAGAEKIPGIPGRVRRRRGLSPAVDPATTVTDDAEDPALEGEK
ncbi:hypothetical protein CVU37_05020 [candidate division BRC1 bacterium HGW-BRC1-1]|nr:MAG: hypothetical protein CVU37_05020 [candidate division BRC1 bacterium HGW-BRC1-1]